MELGSTRAQIRQILTSKTGDQPYLGSPAPEESIARAESELGVTFPRSYRAFLEECGAALAFGRDIARNLR
jgi:hypothetical protein